jgi:hypothetical protein
MTFLIADTFTESLTRLTGLVQKAVKTTAFETTEREGSSSGPINEHEPVGSSKRAPPAQNCRANTGCAYSCEFGLFARKCA